MQDEAVGVDRDEHGKKGLAEWARAPFYRFFSYLEEEHKLLHLSVRGISSLSKQADLAEALYEGDEDHAQRERIEQARTLAATARKEAERQFPLMHAHATIALWSVLESLAEDVAVSWLSNDPRTLQLEKVGKLRIPLAQFELVERDERMRYIAQLLREDAKAALRAGTDQLDAVLDILALGGPVPEDTRKKLYELQQVRNVLVHRRSTADSYLLSRCPWLPWQGGDAVVISPERFKDYEHAALEYGLHIINRIRTRCGLKEIWSTAMDASQPAKAVASEITFVE